MKKILFALIIAASIVSCKADRTMDDMQQKQQNKTEFSTIYFRVAGVEQSGDTLFSQTTQVKEVIAK